MKLLVTGARGLIGRGLIQSLQDDDQFQITATSRRRIQQPGRVHWVKTDLNDLDECLRLIEDQDAVVHLAQPAIPLTSGSDLATEVHSNLVTTLNLITAIRLAANCPRVIFPSSGGALYGSGKARALREDDCCNPSSPYGVLKLTVEHYLRLAAEHREMTAVVLRIANAYGLPLPPDRLQGLVGTAISRLRAGLPIRIIGSPSNVRDYVHIDDISTAIRSALLLDTRFETVNIGGGVGASVSEVIDMIEHAWGSPIDRVVETHPNAAWLPARIVLDVERARRVLHWQPKVTLREGIEQMLKTPTHL